MTNSVKSMPDYCSKFVFIISQLTDAIIFILFFKVRIILIFLLYKGMTRYLQTTN